MVTSGGPDDGEVASGSSIRSSERETRSVISFCDQPAPQHPTHTSHPTRCFPSAGAPATLSGFAASTTSPMMTSPSRSPGACDLPALNVSCGQSGSCSDWDARVSSLRTLVSGRFGQEVDAGKLDVDGREWTVGREFQLLDSNPVNCATDGQRRGSSSLIFSITHRGRKYMLKVCAFQTASNDALMQYALHYVIVVHIMCMVFYANNMRKRYPEATHDTSVSNCDRTRWHPPGFQHWVFCV